MWYVNLSILMDCFSLGLLLTPIITARYSNDLHELLEKLLLLSEIATLSFAAKIGSAELSLSIDVASQQSTDQASQKSQDANEAFQSSTTFQKLLEEWDEPVQSASSENVRLEL